MEKNVFLKFAKSLGFNINEDAIIDNEYDMAYPDNWDEMSEEEQMKWKEEHKVMANVQKPEPKPASVIPAELMQLNALVKEVGGVSALRDLLLSAATVTANALTQEEQERETLTASILANSSEFSEEELKSVETPILRKLATVAVPRMTNYASLGSVNANAKDKIAPRPSFFLNKKEA